ncbi:MAG: hypothetical protein HY823_01350 [Acidobacteria bacterium]|nr:hypothetical protein [Acidobacteriota bacterium]
MQGTLLGPLRTALLLWGLVPLGAQTSPLPPFTPDAPSATASIPVRLGSVDAVQGNLGLRIPLGPKLPGRIPLGFVWTLHTNDGLRSGIPIGERIPPNLGGSFKPVEWPDLADPSTSPAQATVLYQGSQLSFHRSVPAGVTLPDKAKLLAWATQRGVDTGQTEAESYLGPDPGAGGVVFQVDFVYPASDGTRFFLDAYWHVDYLDPVDERMKHLDLPKRSIVLLEDQAIWSIRAQNVTHVTNRWGDHVTITESGGQPGAPTRIVLQNLAVTADTISLDLTGVLPLAYWEDGVSLVDSSPTATLTVINSLGLPTATLTGRYRSHQRKTPWNPQGGSTWAGIFDGGFLPLSWAESAANQTRTTTFVWSPNRILAPGRTGPGGSYYPPYEGTPALPVEVSHPEGLTETFTYAESHSLGAFSYDNGVWSGWKPFRDSGEIPAAGTPVPGKRLMGVQTITTTSGDPGDPGRTVLIAKVWPRAQVDQATGMDDVYTQPEHLTHILTYPSAAPGAGTPFRGERITHPKGRIWAVDPVLKQPALGDTQVYAFATAMILGREKIRGSGFPGSADLASGAWRPAVSDVDQVTVVDGYDLRSWANPAGAVGLPLNPVAMRTQVHTRDLPKRTLRAGGTRDAYGPTQSDEVVEPPQGQFPPAVDNNPPEMWSASLPIPGSGPIHRKGMLLTRAWNDALGALQSTKEQKTLAGSALPGLRVDAQKQPVTSVDFGTTDITFDPKGRIESRTGTRTPFVSQERTVSFLGDLPLPTRVEKTLTNNSVPVPAHPTLPVTAGHEYTYDPGPQHWLTGERDLVDGRWTTYQRDGLGRETQRTDPLGIVTTTEYDGWGRTWRVTRLPRGAVGALASTTTYDPNGRWKEESVAGETRTLVTRTTLDAHGRVVRVDFPDGSRQLTAYNEWGLKASQTPVLKPDEAEYGRTTWTYDPLDRVESVTDPRGRRLSTVTRQPTWMLETMSGRTGVVTTVQDDRNNPRTTVTDLLGQKAAVVDQAGQVSTYTYDEDGRLCLTEQGNQVRSYTYNKIGWLTDRLEPEEGATHYDQHNLLGMPRTVAQKGRSGNRSNLTTTDLNAWLLPQTVTATGPEGTVTRQFGIYDPGSHLPAGLTESMDIVGVGTSTLTETYLYDDLYRLRSKTVSDGSQSFTVSRVLDAFGQESSLSYPSGGGRAAQTVTTTYDASRRPWDVKLEGVRRGLMTYGPAVGATVTDTLTYGNGATTAWRRDQGELVQLKHEAGGAVLEDLAIAWSAGGLMLSRGGDSFDYDALQRLSSASVQGLHPGERMEQAFSYDRWGNRSSSGFSYTAGAGGTKPEEVLAWTAAYNGSNDLPSAVNTVNGPLSTGAVYDDLGRLASVEAIPNNTGAHTTSWVYDPSGRVVRERVEGVTASFLLDGEGLRFRRTNGTEGTTQYTVYSFHREPLAVFAVGSGSHGGQKGAAVHHATAGAGALSRALGAFAAGDTVTASVWFKAPAGVSGLLAIHDGKIGAPTDSKKCVSLAGNGAWQQLSITFTLQRADNLWIHLYGDMFTSTSLNQTAATKVVYDDVSVGSTQRGQVLTEGFEAGLAIGTDPLSQAAWYACASLQTEVVSGGTLEWKKSCVYGFGQLLSEETADGTRYIQGDNLGSPNWITDGAGIVVGKSKNLPFGERFGSEGATSIRRFTNHEDQPGSAIYMQARMYLPAYGKFAQVDPAYDQTKDDPESWNLYNYVTNNPVTHSDPDGRAFIISDGKGGHRWATGQEESEYEGQLGLAPGATLIILTGGDKKSTGGKAPAPQGQSGTDTPAAELSQTKTEDLSKGDLKQTKTTTVDGSVTTVRTETEGHGGDATIKGFSFWAGKKTEIEKSITTFFGLLTFSGSTKTSPAELEVNAGLNGIGVATNAAARGPNASAGGKVTVNLLGGFDLVTVKAGATTGSQLGANAGYTRDKGLGAGFKAAFGAGVSFDFGILNFFKRNGSRSSETIECKTP